MKERPILFKDEMIRAILDGRKTQTRRVVKPQPSNVINDLFIWRDNATPRDELMASCPYGQPGDQLWVRETYFGNHFQHPNEPEDERELHYLADGLPCFEGEEDEIRWRPSIHMPRWASRLQLEIVNVRVERLQDISESDALEEGITYNHIPNNGLDPMRARTWFRGLWESINGPGSWDLNPWVWVVEFKRM